MNFFSTKRWHNFCFYSLDFHLKLWRNTTNLFETHSLHFWKLREEQVVVLRKIWT